MGEPAGVPWSSAGECARVRWWCCHHGARRKAVKDWGYVYVGVELRRFDHRKAVSLDGKCGFVAVG